MSNKIRYCLICKQYDGKAKRSSYTRISNIEREQKLREGYRRRYNGEELIEPILNQIVHKKCYNKIVQVLPSVDETISSNDLLTTVDQTNNIDDDDDHEDQDQTLVVQSRSCVSMPCQVKHLLERCQRVCIVCNSYKYTHANRMRQIVSNFMANKLAEGYLHRYKRPYGKSLLDAYIHDACYRKLYSSYRYHPSRRIKYPTSVQTNINPILYSPHETRSRTNPNKLSWKSNEIESEIIIDDDDDDDDENISIEKLLSTPFSVCASTNNPNTELSARADLFRPCLQRISPEEIERYTKRNTVLQQINEDNSLIPDQLPVVQASTIETSTTNDSIIYPNEDQSAALLHSLCNKPQKALPTAEIRPRYSKPASLAKPSNPLIYDHIYTSNPHGSKPSDDLEELSVWLIDELKSSGRPMSMNEVVKKHQELTNEVSNTTTTKHDNHCRTRLKARLERFYSKEFIFIVPNKRDGTYVALNNIEHYLRHAIKNTQQATETSILSSVITPLQPPVDYKRETCETIMNGIRKIRLYIRDSKQINHPPSLLMQNIIGLIAASEKQFDKISHQYDFYRMIDENLFENSNQIKPNHKLDKNIRNMSLASDLISARHDNHISQKHFLLADEIAKETFHCTPRQVITLLNRYGHTCSYKSYKKIKTLKERMIHQLGENLVMDDEKSSDSELELMEL